ncbi:DUF4268 domain-containing protein [Bradyrhizobium sp. HKCCYLS2058]|uniref:DUF4268 domain-containing protein n=1 Tax=unclassified Bradyrhizobium TaxID=2631580 RepID=UPI002915F3FE|nr:DUF4268 domain-containing protein [Bradyrhizobium sp. SZCCHNR1015]
MNSIIPLGKFENVPVREAWPAEDDNFTPWLAQPDAITILGKALNLELEVEAVEHWVGAFKADILARIADEQDDHRVIIENQFERTDHKHLGQILTYLAGIEGAKTIIWIAEVIQPDHRAAIDWLNTNTAEDFSFFAVEVELWRIGNSPPAPRFNVIASPNDWTRSARTATRQVAGAVRAQSDAVRLGYWSSFSEYLKKNGSAFQLKRPNSRHYYNFPTGRSGIPITVTFSTDKERIGVELYVYNDVEKAVFRTLLADKQTIDAEFGEQLDWQELPQRKASRIALFRSDINPTDEKQYLELHAWMLDKMNRFWRVFVPRVKSMRPSGEAGSVGQEAEDD